MIRVAIAERLTERAADQVAHDSHDTTNKRMYLDGMKAGTFKLW